MIPHSCSTKLVKLKFEWKALFVFFFFFFLIWNFMTWSNGINFVRNAGFMCNCVLPVTLNSTKVRHNNKIGDNNDKPLEGEKKRLTSESNNGLNSSNSPSSSSSSPSTVTTTTRRGRSRTRRALPPSSPLIVGSSSSWET